MKNNFKRIIAVTLKLNLYDENSAAGYCQMITLIPLVFAHFDDAILLFLFHATKTRKKL